MMKEILISSESIEPRQRTEYCIEVFRPLHMSAPLDDPGLKITLRAQMRGPLELWETQFNSQQYQRDLRTIARSDADTYVVIVVCSGDGAGDFNNTNIASQSGDIVIVDSTQPYRSRVDAGKRLVAVVPRAPLEKLIGRRNLHGVVLKAGQPMTTLITDYLKGLQTLIGQMTGDELAGAQDGMYSLLAGGLSGKGSEYADATAIAALSLRQKIIDLIDQHITNPELDVDFLMRYSHISRSNLYRIFETDGGIARLIREKRLDLAYRLLSGSTSETRTKSITIIAGYCGFSSYEHFTRAFKARFGITPRTAQKEKPSFSIPSSRSFDSYRFFKVMADN
ncbi:helix-turn-helix domain-containing protein [Paraburkholderia adhaesiva]|uniref:helix-turn-helix domain-containing protein n=1 Tax=Paraburkholderia adhaesiva TaxID=2883244 RepID=UPI001F43CA84|nr:helix-turn-helix domain-containing protein [Paraburkholderia adhaesiva]